MKLPASVQEIADVIGSERALFLVGQLPRCYIPDRRKREAERGGHAERVIMYVPKNLKPDHYLVRILGWHDAFRLQQEFAGEILYPGTCADVYRGFRDKSIRRLAAEGLPNVLIAEWFGVTERHVRGLLRAENPLEVTPGYANDNAACFDQQARSTA